MKNLQKDIVVIAAGPAGLCAAVQAAEDGAKVLVLEKSAVAGGAANMGMGPLGIGTKYQKAAMQEVSLEKAYKMFMEYTHYMVDGRLVKHYFERSAETIEWLEDMGVEFEGAFRYFPKSEPTWHIVKTGEAIGPRAASVMVKALVNRAEELGVEFLYHTPAEEIVMEEGRVAAVKATGSDGEELMIACKAVIIATGGAGANKELIRQETGYEWGENLFSFAIPGLVGDGIRMAWSCGAARTNIRIELTARVGNKEELPASVKGVFMQPNLLVNLQGKRFMNEDDMQNITFLGNAISQQKGKKAFCIIDSSIARHYMRQGLDIVNLVRSDPSVSEFAGDMEELVRQGTEGFYQGDTIEELAGSIGIDPGILEDTVEEYNDACDSYDEEFFKDRKYMQPIRRGPFYAAAVYPSGYGTVGGVKINEYAEVLDPEFEPIPGLYCAGTDANAIYEDSYMFLLPGNTMGFAVNTGRFAGERAAEYVRENL